MPSKRSRGLTARPSSAMLILIQDRGSGWHRFLCISPHQSDERRSIEDGGRWFWNIEIDFMDGHEPKCLIRHQIRNILYITLTRLRLLDGVCSPWKGWKYLEQMFLNMEPAVGIEPTTDGLQNRCSTGVSDFRKPFKSMQKPHYQHLSCCLCIQRVTHTNEHKRKYWRLSCQ